MSLEKLITPFPWQRYSKKLAKRIDNPRSAGFFSAENANERGMRLVVGTEGTKPEGNMVSLYFLVDPSDGMIVDAKFQTFGQSALIGAADAACDLIVGKNYDQAHRISADFIDKYLLDLLLGILGFSTKSLSTKCSLTVTVFYFNSGSTIISG